MEDILSNKNTVDLSSFAALGFSCLGHGVSLHGCSSKAQPLLLTLDGEGGGYLFMAASPDPGGGVALLGCCP